MHMVLTYSGTLTLLNILTHYRNDNDIKPLAVLTILKSFISLSNDFNTTNESNPLALSANNRILYELTISSPSLSIKVLSSLSYLSEIYASIFMIGFPLVFSETKTFSFLFSVSLQV